MLGGGGVGVLGCEGAVLWYPGVMLVAWRGVPRRCVNVPVLWIMRLLERIAHTCMARCKHPIALAAGTRRIQLQFHKLVHVLQDQHVAV